jgi:ribosomal protein S18 acetylase RimI-like enzyme
MLMEDIRKIQENDLPNLAELFVSVFNEPPWSENWKYDWAYQRLHILFNSYGFYGCLAESRNGIVGSVLTRIGSYKGELELEIAECFVSKNEQRKGVGSALLNNLKLYAKNEGISSLVLFTDRNTYASKFYKKYGFQSHEENIFMSHDV